MFVFVGQYGVMGTEQGLEGQTDLGQVLVLVLTTCLPWVVYLTSPSLNFIIGMNLSGSKN